MAGIKFINQLIYLTIYLSIYLSINQLPIPLGCYTEPCPQSSLISATVWSVHIQWLC